MAPNLLPWLPTDLTDEVASWDFTHKVSSAMSDIGQAGADLMKPIGQQLAQLIPDPPAPPPPPPPPPEAPPTPRYDLGTAEDWGFGSAPAPASDVKLAPSPPPQAEMQPVTHAAGSFQLPEPSAFLGQASETAGRATQAVGQAATQAATQAVETVGRAGQAVGQTLGSFAIDRSSPSAFLGSFRPAAEAALKAKGYPTSLAPILAAIPMNEQGWQKEAPGSNYYGIKGSNPRTGANTGPVGTWEDYGGGRTNIRDTFRAYGSPAESVADFLDFLETNPRYGAAVKIGRETGDPAQFIKAVHAAGYATDPAWSDKILSIASQVPAQTAGLAQAGLAAAGRAIAPSASFRSAAGTSTASTSSEAGAGSLDSAGIEAAYKGVPYTFGGPGGRTNAALGTPTDCSGFVSAVWQDRYGVPLVAHTDGAYNQLKGLGAREVEQKDARPGDVVFYMGAGTGGAITHHMGIYAGDGRVLDMSVSGGDGVKERPVGHGGAFVIMRDPRLGESTPRGAPSPPPIVETGVAEVSGGRKPSQARIDAASEAGPILSPFSATPARDPISEPWSLPFGSAASLTSQAGDAASAVGSAASGAASSIGSGIRGAAETVGRAASGVTGTLGDAASAIDTAERGLSMVMGPVNPISASRFVAEHADPLGGVPRMSGQMREIERQYAADTGRNPNDPANLGLRDQQWRARNPEKAAEYDDLMTQAGLNVAGQVGDLPHAAKVGVEAAAPFIRRGAEALGEGARGLGTRVTEHLAENAARTAALDAGMAADPAYSATLMVPEGSPVRGRKLRDAPPMDLSEAEAPGFARAAEELSQGRYGPDSAEAVDPSHPLEWHDQVVRINNKGQYDGDHPVSLPFYRNGSGDMIPLEPADVGPMGSPVNSAYNAAVKAAGGRKGFVYGRWRDERGVRHEFDSPQEVVAMVDLDARLAEGAIDSWWSQANNPYPDLEKIPYASTNRDKGGLKNYVPDLIVRHHDGSLEVIEIKSPEVIAKAEEYGMKAGEVSGKMGWDVVKKAAGIMAGLADRGVRYRLMLPHQVLETGRIPLGSNIAGQGARSRRLDLLPGVDPRDAPKMRRKTITPAAGSPGVEIARVVDETSGRLMDEADRLKGLGVSDDERLRLLTRMARDDLLPTAELATSAPVPAAAVARGQPAAPTTPGRQEGLTRNLLAGGEAPLGSNVRHRGPLSLEDLDEWDPDSGRILREAEEDGGKLTNLAIHDGPGGASRLIYEIDGDPQAAIRASGRLAQYHGADEAARGIWYRDAKGKHPVAGLDLDAPGGDFDAIRAAIADDWPDAPMVVPRYNSERLLEGIDLYGRSPDGAPMRDDVLRAARRRAQAALEADGIPHRPVPTQRAEMSRFAGEPGHASSPEAAVERAEQILGRRRITVDQADRAQAAKRAAAAAQRAAERGGAGRSAAVAGGGAGQPAGTGAPEGALGRLGGPPSALDVDDLEDLLDEDDLLDAGVSLIGPYPSARGASAAATLGQRALATAGQSLAGGVSGSYLGAGAPAETDEERRRNALVGAGLGLVGGPVLSRGIGAVQRRAGAGTRGALATIGAPGSGVVPEAMPPPGGLAAQFPVAGTWYQRQLQRNAAKMAAAGIAPASAVDVVRGAASSLGHGAMLGPSTAGVNTLQSLWNVGWALPKEPLRAAGRAISTGNAAALREPGEMAFGAARGMTRLGEAVWDVVRGSGKYAPVPGHEPTSARVADPFLRGLLSALEAPGRIFGGLPDAISGTIAEGSVAARRAAQKATDAGLSGADWEDEVDRLVTEAEAHRTATRAGAPPADVPDDVADVVAAADKAGEEAGLRQPLGTIGTAARKVAKLGDAPVIGEFVAPYFNTPWNAMLQMAERSPAGLVMNRQSSKFDKYYDAVVGSAAALALGDQMRKNNITVNGSGPTDPNERQAWIDQGNRPYSIKVGDLYVPNRVFAYGEGLLNAVGEYHDALAYRKPEADSRWVQQDAFARIGRLLKEQPYAAGYATIADMAQHGPAALAADLATRLTPGAATFRAIGTARDTAERATERGAGVPLETEALERWQQSVGMRSGLPVAQDILGRPKENPQPGAAAFFPRVGRERDDPVIAIFQDAGVFPGDPPPKLAVPNLPDEALKPDLTPEERRRWDALRGEMLAASVGPLAGDPGWAAIPREVRAKELERRRQEAGALAHQRLAGEIGADEIRRRIDEKVRQRAGRAER